MRPDQMRHMEGRTVGKRYRIGRFLRYSAAGDIYECRDITADNSRLVIRIPPVLELRENSEELGRRIVLLQKFRHQQIESVFDFGRLAETGALYLILKRTDGSDFYSGTKNSGIQDILTLFDEILQILRYPHTRKMIHGNLTPESVLLLNNSEGQNVPFLRDFSLFRRTDNSGGFSSHESICYSAPELLLEGREGKETDFFALGVLLYQALTRRLPFEDSDPDFLIQKQIQGNIDLGPVERMEGGRNVVPLLERLLEKDAAKRISSIDEALSLLPSQTRRDFDLSGGRHGRFSAAPFVEREKEMRLLRERAELVKKNGRGWTVFIAGEAGSGKTRCMEELRGWALLNGWRVVQGFFSAHEESPYAPFTRILGKTDFKEKGTGSFSEDISLAAESETQSSGFASGWFQDRLTRELLRRLSGRPTILLLHDIHWASEEACIILDYLCSDTRTRPIFICAGFRSDEIAEDAIRRVIDGVRRGKRGETVSLESLTKNGVRQMISGLTGINNHPEYPCGWMFRTVGGNPFFLKEMLEYLAEREILRNKFGIWKFAAPFPAKPEVPAAIGSILRKRLLRLSTPAMETLQWLSLFHRAVPRKYTELLTDYDGGRNDASLAELNKSRMLRMESSIFNEAIAPAYEMIAKITREMIPQERKRKMYREIAELLEREVGNDQQCEAALHYTESHPDDHSIRCALKAVNDFNAVFDHENALRCFQYVFKNENRLTAQETFQAMISACDSMCALGEAQQAIGVIKSALYAQTVIEPEMKARLYLCLAMAYRHAGDWRCQEQNCKTGLKILRRLSLDERFTETSLWTELAISAVMRSNTRNALRFLDRAIAACTDRNSPALFGKIHNLYAILYCASDDFKKAADAGETALAVLSHSEETIQKCSALSAVGLAYMKRSRFASALRLHLSAAALSEKSRSAVLRARANGKLAECLCRMGQIQNSFAAIDQALAAAKESNNPVICRACDAIAAEINLAAHNYSETRRILKTLECGEKDTLSFFTAGRADYLSAELNFRLGDFAAASEKIQKLRARKIAQTPLYEFELAQALDERVIFERDNDPGSLQRLRALENRAARKHWPHQRCIIKLHICEILISLKSPEEAAEYARNALRLAVGMRSISLQCRAQLMLGISLSRLQRKSCAKTPAGADIRDADAAIRSLNDCVNLADSSYSLECRWRALAELCFIYRFYKKYELCFNSARQAHEALVKLENLTPSDMLDSFHATFDRGRIKHELARIIETGQPLCRVPHAVKCTKSANAEILLRMAAIINSVREISPLLDGLLELALSAIDIDRGLIFLWDEAADKLEQAGGRDAKNGSMVFTDDISHAILESVFSKGKPIVSADAGNDPRIMKSDYSALPGKMLCIPLKTPERTIGVFYGDIFNRVENIREAEIDIANAFCSLTALAVDNIMARRRLTQTGARTISLQAPDTFPEIIGASLSIKRLKNHISLAAASPLDILITGESGSGKELIARAISNGDRNRNGKFIPVDCGTLSDGIAEAELFGCRKGAFTGANENRVGLIEAANGGVLFLDEISNMPQRMQVKLLRALQEREVRRIGETVPRKIEIRVVAATNKDIAEEIKNGRFCGDLFYRLKVVEIHSPPLRERAEDIPLLIEGFLKNIFDKERGVIRRFSQEAMDLLQQYSYPGNIRELKNIVASAYYSSSGDVIEAGALPVELRVRKTTETAFSSTADNLYLRILSGDGGFVDMVKKPYLDRRIESSVVRGVIQRALRDATGVYRSAFARLRIPEHNYASTMQFLKRHGCYLDFLPFRRDSE